MTSKSTYASLLWIDLEMTGLDPAQDRIVELAAIATDWQFNEIGILETGVGQPKKVLTERFNNNPWAMSRPAETEELIRMSLTSPTEEQVIKQLSNFIISHFHPEEPILLAGNSIHCDRGFIKHWWPAIESRLHYRMLDVSAWKVVMQGKYGVSYPKSETHRALQDIRESIAELQFYLNQRNF